MESVKRGVRVFEATAPSTSIRGHCPLNGQRQNRGGCNFPSRRHLPRFLLHQPLNEVVCYLLTPRTGVSSRRFSATGFHVAWPQKVRNVEAFSRCSRAHSLGRKGEHVPCPQGALPSTKLGQTASSCLFSQMHATKSSKTVACRGFHEVTATPPRETLRISCRSNWSRAIVISPNSTAKGCTWRSVDNDAKLAQICDSFI